MRRAMRFGLVGLLALGAAAPAVAKGPDMDAAVKAAMAETGAKGVAVALIDKGKVVSVKTMAIATPRASR